MDLREPQSLIPYNLFIKIKCVSNNSYDQNGKKTFKEFFLQPLHVNQ